MNIRNFQIEIKLSKIKIKKFKCHCLDNCFFGALKSLAYILVVLTLTPIIIASSRILVNFLGGEHVIRKNDGALR